MAKRMYISFDAAGRLASRTDAKYQTTHYQYDAVGNLTNINYPNDADVSFTYDALNRKTSMTDAIGIRTNVYDAYGRMATMKTWRDTNAAPDVTRWNYDEATGLLTNKVYADGKGPSYEYDSAGRLTKRTWARGVETDYAYNFSGQLTNIAYSDSTPDVALTYDRLGRQLTATDALGTRTNHYDAVALLSEQLPDGAVLSRSYDSMGRPVGFDLNNSYTNRYAYDDVGRFCSITSTLETVSTLVQYEYLTNSALISGWTIQDASGTNMVVSVTKSYEPHRDLVTSVVNTGSVSLISQFDYVNDAVGRRTERVDSSIITNTFSYNIRSELTEALMGTNSYGYAYDPIGNRVAATDNGAATAYAVNELNQYTNIAPATGEPAYDLDGNLISDGAWIYSWDAENRMVDVSPATTNIGSVRLSFAHDYMSRRVRKKVEAWDGSMWGNTVTSLYTYDGWNLICEDRSDDNKNNYYVWGLDLSGTPQGAGGVGGLLARVREENIPRPLYYAGDANGNITDLVDTNGAVVAHYEYDPYGNTIARSGAQADANPFRFSSKYWDDEIGLYYYGYRYYSPGMGRWPNRDPIGEAGGKNLYWFVGNHPTGSFDTDGRIEVSSCETALNTALRSNAKAKKLMEELTKRHCPEPEPYCKCCSANERGGGFDPQSKRVMICANAWSSGAGIIAAVVHELTHALDDCKGTDWSNCEERACSEIRAYDQGGTCASGGLDRQPGESYRDCVKRKATASTTADPSCTAADVESQMGACFGSEL